MSISLRRSLVVGTVAAVVGGAALSVAAAGTPVTFQLNWMAGGPNAGFAAAVAEGYYKDVGLDVTLVQGNGSGNTAQLVANGVTLLSEEMDYISRKLRLFEGPEGITLELVEWVDAGPA